MTPVPPPPGTPRPEPRDVAELKRLKASSPHLASAVDFQLAVIETERRVDARIPLPRIIGLDDLCAGRLASGQRLLEFDELTLDWSDLRRLLTQGADLLVRSQMLEAEDARRLQEIVRDGRTLPLALHQWYDHDPDGDVALSQAFLLGLRPYLARAAAALLPRVAEPVSAWQRATCPVCGGEPDFAVWAPGERRLVCGRCAGQWPFAEERCPFCEEGAAVDRRSFASQTRAYRVEACDRCRRYLKGVDEVRAARALLLGFDVIATIPLDAAAVQMGYG